MIRRVSCIVEGHAETESVPLLLRRIHAAVPGTLRFPDVRKADVIRMPRSRLLREGELERAVELAARRVGSDGAILILLDADDDPACQHGPALLARARAARPDVGVSVVFAVREYEAWFLAAADSLRGHCGLSDDIAPPEQPEAVRDAKGWLSSRMAGKYRPVIHQPKLTAVVDLSRARSAASFDKLWRDVCGAVLK